MNNQNIFFTGATDGIGKLTAIALAQQEPEATILIHGRNKAKLEKAVIDIVNTSGNPKIEPYLADLSSLDEVRQLAASVLAAHDRLSILINNAGAGFAAPRYGKDGTETRLTVNYLAVFLLTRLLLPALRKAAPARIVNVGSGGQSPIHFDDIMMEKDFDGVTAYTQSKLALLMFSFDLAEALKGDRITVNCLHPGTYLDTNMVREAGIEPHGKAETGAAAVLYLALSPDLKDASGKYFNQTREARAHAQAYDADARDKLKRLTLKLTGLPPLELASAK